MKVLNNSAPIYRKGSYIACSASTDSDLYKRINNAHPKDVINDIRIKRGAVLVYIGNDVYNSRGEYIDEWEIELRIKEIQEGENSRENDYLWGPQS